MRKFLQTRIYRKNVKMEGWKDEDKRTNFWRNQNFPANCRFGNVYDCWVYIPSSTAITAQLCTHYTGSCN